MQEFIFSYWLGFLYLFFVIFSVSLGQQSEEVKAKSLSQRYEEAKVLLEGWDKWASDQDDSTGAKRKEGDACNVKTEDTLALTYYRRFYYTIQADRSRRPKMLTHIAERLDFYQQRMGTGRALKIPNLKDFCRGPKLRGKIPKFNGEFNWPSKLKPANYLMCENNQCTSCEDVKRFELVEACYLRTPESEIEAPPLSHVFEIYNRVIRVSPDFMRRERKGKEVGIEGETCDATPIDTLLFVMSKRLSSTPTDDEYNRTTQYLKLIEENVKDFESIVGWQGEQEFKAKKYCKTSLVDKKVKRGREDANSAEYWMKGGYVCGGESCKPCKVPPIMERGRQVWNFEEGPLHEACKLITELNEDAKTQEELEEDREKEMCMKDDINEDDSYGYREKDKCPPVEDPCKKENDKNDKNEKVVNPGYGGGGGGGGDEGRDEKPGREKTNYEVWLEEYKSG